MAFQKTGRAEQIGEKLTFEEMLKRKATEIAKEQEERQQKNAADTPKAPDSL